MLKKMVIIFSVVFCSGVHAHIGDKIYPIYEYSAEDLGTLFPLDGQSLDEWKDLMGEPMFLPTDLYQHPNVGDGAQYDPQDLDYKIWMGYNSENKHVFFAIERYDNVYFGREYAGSSPWNYEGVELMLDGDHTGGDYTGFANPDWTDEEKTLNNNRHAQHYITVADDLSGRHVSYLGAGSEWVNDVPYANGGGNSIGSMPTKSIIEFYVTPFDDLIWNDPEGSTVSDLADGDIIGFQISIPDTDQGPGMDRAFHTLSDQAATWRYADRFVDARLVEISNGVREGDYSEIRDRTPDQANKGIDMAERARSNKGRRSGKAAVVTDSWARIKASLSH